MVFMGFQRYEKESRGLSAEAQMKAIQAKLAKLEQGVDAETELGRLGKTGNKHVFNTRGKGSGVWNGTVNPLCTQIIQIYYFILIILSFFWGVFFFGDNPNTNAVPKHGRKGIDDGNACWTILNPLL